MVIRRLYVRSFRNYAEQSVELGEGANIFVGDNAQGKTNLLEAVRLLSIGKSARTPRDKELIRWGSNEAVVCAEVAKQYGTEKVEAHILRTGGKKFFINSMELGRIGELMGAVGTVFFSPDELKVIKESPAERRRFIDISISQLSKSYFFALTRYLRILSQRNRFLKNPQKFNSGVLEIWNEQLAREGARIIKSRKGFIKRLEAEAAHIHAHLTDDTEKLALEYQSLLGESTIEIEQAFKKELSETTERDLTYGNTGTGPHKDDLKISVNAIDVRAFGSQGQQRTAALSLKLACINIYKAETGEKPILLLDDVLSELDRTRQQRLLALAQNTQTIITATHVDSTLAPLLSNPKVFTVKEGKILI